MGRWQKRISEREYERQRLLDAYQAGVIELEELTERQNPILTSLRQLEAKLANASRTTALTISVEDFIQKIQQVLAATEKKAQQKVIRLLIDRIVVTCKALSTISSPC